MRIMRLLLLAVFALSLPILSRAQENCYESQRSKGIQLYNQGEYAKASKFFEAAKYCTDLPSNNDLDAWLEKCVIVVKLSSKRLTFDATGGEDQVVEVSTNAKSFRVSNECSWCTVTQQAKSFTVICDDNTEVAPRETRLTITSGGKTVYLEVFQEAAGLEFKFDPNSVVFGSSASLQRVYVVSNVPDWTVASVPSWLIAERKEDSLSLACTKNSSPFARNAEVMISAHGQEFPLPVRQHPGDTVVETHTSEMVFANDGGMDRVRVFCNMDQWDVESSDNWIDVRKEQDSVKVMATDNPSVFSRHGSFKVFCGSRFTEVAVHQAPHVSSFTMPESELKNMMISDKETIMVTSIPPGLRVHIDDSLTRATPFSLHVDFEHHSLLLGFERREYLFNEKQQDIEFKPGLRFANITYTSPKIIGLRTGFVSANKFGGYTHFQASLPIVKEFVLDSISPRGYHLFMGPIYQPIQYAAVYAGVGIGVYEGAKSGKLDLPMVGFDYEAGVMGFYKHMMLSAGFRSSRWSGHKSTTFVVGVGGYLKRYYDKKYGYCAGDSRRWWSVNYVARPADHGRGVMFGDLGSERFRAYLKGLYLTPNDSIKNGDFTIGFIVTPLDGLIDLCVGTGMEVNFKGSTTKTPKWGVEAGVILNLWRIPLTVMLHETDLLNDHRLVVDLGIGFHLGDFKRSSYK